MIVLKILGLTHCQWSIHHTLVWKQMRQVSDMGDFNSPWSCSKCTQLQYNDIQESDQTQHGEILYLSQLPPDQSCSIYNFSIILTAANLPWD